MATPFKMKNPILATSAKTGSPIMENYADSPARLYLGKKTTRTNDDGSEKVKNYLGASSSPKCKVPLKGLPGQRVGSYSMLAFFFWKHVNYEVDDYSFLSGSIKQGNRFVGMTKDTGHSSSELNVIWYLICTVPLLIKEPGDLKTLGF